MSRKSSHTERRQSSARNPYRPGVEILEERLPPGDPCLALLTAAVQFFSTHHLWAEAWHRPSPRPFLVAETSTTDGCPPLSGYTALPADGLAGAAPGTPAV